MKKLLLILWLCAVVAACGGGGEEESEPNYQPGDYLPEGGYLGYDGHTWCIGLNVGYPQCQPDWEPSVPYEVQYGTIVPAPYVDKSLPINENVDKPIAVYDLAALWLTGEFFQGPEIQACSGPGGFTEYYTTYMGDSAPMGEEYCSQKIHDHTYVYVNQEDKAELQIEFGDHMYQATLKELFGEITFSTTASAYQSRDVTYNVQRFRDAIAPNLNAVCEQIITDSGLISAQSNNWPLYVGIQNHTDTLPYEAVKSAYTYWQCKFSELVNAQTLLDALMPYVFSDKTVQVDLSVLQNKYSGFSRKCWQIAVQSTYRFPFDTDVAGPLTPAEGTLSGTPLDELYNFETNQYREGYSPMQVDTRYITAEGTLKNSNQVSLNLFLRADCIQSNDYE